MQTCVDSTLACAAGAAGKLKELYVQVSTYFDVVHAGRASMLYDARPRQVTAVVAVAGTRVFGGHRPTKARKSYSSLKLSKLLVKLTS